VILQVEVQVLDLDSGTVHEASGKGLFGRDLFRSYPGADLFVAYNPVETADRVEVYDVRTLDDRCSANNPAQQLEATFDTHGVRVTAPATDSQLQLTTTGFGRRSDIGPVASVEPLAHESRVVYPRGEFIEWFVNDASGIEQGFTVLSPPVGEGELVIELSASGRLTPRLLDRDSGVEFVDPGGVARLRYTKLAAWDAHGRVLDSQLQLVDRATLTLHVDDRGAVYPIVIDPAITNESVKLTSSDGHEDQVFGWSVAVDGDTLVVGAPFDYQVGHLAGAAYVFRREGSDWVQEAKLLPDDLDSQDLLGWSVAVEGDTVLIGSLDSDIAFRAGSVYVFERLGGSWIQQAKLVSSDAAENDYFGTSVDLSEDTAVVGAWADDAHGTDSGAAYVFTRDGQSWVQEAKLTPDDAARGDGFGLAVAISGETLVVGSSSGGSGTAYFFKRDGTIWSQQDRVVASDARLEDGFGSALDISGERAVVGAWGNDALGGDAGAAYVFVRDGSSWTEEARLIGSGQRSYDHFGTSVSLVGDVAVVGASLAGQQGVEQAGAAYAFVRTDTWHELTTLLASDRQSEDDFGFSVSVSGSTAVVGARGDDDLGFNAGSVYVFDLDLQNEPPHADAGIDETVECTGALGAPVTLDGSHSVDPDSTPGTRDDIVRYQWLERIGQPDEVLLGEGEVLNAHLLTAVHVITLRVTDRFGVTDEVQVTKTVTGECAPARESFELISDDGRRGDRFGADVAFSDGRIVVGASRADVVGTDSGAAYVYAQVGDTWIQEAKLRGDDLSPFGWFGSSVAIRGRTLVVGAPLADGVVVDSGAAYVFERSTDDEVWNQAVKLIPDHGMAFEAFGWDVALSDDTAVVGAYSARDRGTDAGSVYVFTRSGGNWVQQAQLLPDDLAPGDRFGNSVAIEGDTIVAGAYTDDSAVGVNTGAVYVFRRMGDTWTQEAKLVPDGIQAGALFGASVSLSGATLAVGAGFDAERGHHSGSVYVLARDGTRWFVQAKLLAADQRAEDEFGFSTVIQGDMIAVGAWAHDDRGSNSGTAYLFFRDGANWQQSFAELLPDGVGPGDAHGFSIAISDGRAVIGTPQLGGNLGRAYLFDIAAPNHPPLAEAGSDVSVECNTSVVLDGSTSDDPDSTVGTNDDIATFEWFEYYGEPTETLLGSGPILVALLPYGSHTVTLRVTDRSGAQATDVTVVSVEDTVPPRLSVDLSPTVLWPPDHRMVDVVATVLADDSCEPPTVVLRSISIDEPGHALGPSNGTTGDSVRNAGIGTADFEFAVRAERAGSGAGRTYTVVYVATDAAGNESAAREEVRVPHDRGCRGRSGSPACR
jgi:hypothetical protein